MTTDNNLDAMKKASWRSAIITLLSFLLIGFSLIYSAVKLNTLQQEVVQKKTEIEQLAQKKQALIAEITLKEQSLEEISRQLSVLTKIINIVGSENSELAKQAIEQVIQTDTDVADIVPRIYIHIRNELQREGAKRIVKKLQEQGYIVPGIEKIEQTQYPIRMTQIRYFQKREENEATEISLILKQLGVMDAIPEHIPGYENSVPPRQYEIWFRLDSNL